MHVGIVGQEPRLGEGSIPGLVHLGQVAIAGVDRDDPVGDLAQADSPAVVYGDGLTVLDGQLYFWGGPGGGPYGDELWTSDGTREGTRLFFDALPGRKSSTQQSVSQPVVLDLNQVVDQNHADHMQQVNGAAVGIFTQHQGHQSQVPGMLGVVFPARCVGEQGLAIDGFEFVHFADKCDLLFQAVKVHKGLIFQFSRPEDKIIILNQKRPVFKRQYRHFRLSIGLT